MEGRRRWGGGSSFDLSDPPRCEPSGSVAARCSLPLLAESGARLRGPSPKQWLQPSGCFSGPFEAGG
eukprot:2660459-Alexandrium_andersonii.AAC.1